ncbi:unnamed protein product [Caenorhabditis bovis]|uniref:Uncharacterized protein n=1 Tax=Caenorhabditis bovis TaxID=2654633 RepID=A0A8S1F9Z5_9PELO|nr:unnamed protein product [Caenorhabditis bovis]
MQTYLIAVVLSVLLAFASSQYLDTADDAYLIEPVSRQEKPEREMDEIRKTIAVGEMDEEAICRFGKRSPSAKWMRFGKRSGDVAGAEIDY